MVTKTDLKRLMSKGLTGKEAAKLILQDSWEVDHRRDGFLSKADIQRIKGGLKTQGDIQEYNRLIHAYQLVDYTLKEARILALEACQALLLASKELEVYWLEDKIRWGMFYGLPAIVTQKQYAELKAKQREYKLQTLHTLWAVFDSRAYKVAPPEVQEASEGELANFLMEEQPELYKETVRQISQLIREGKLKPVRIDEQARASLQALYELQEEQRNKEKADPTLVPSGTIEVWDAFGKQEDQIVRASYERGRSRLTEQDREELLRLLERYVQTDTLPEEEQMSDEEQSKLIDYTYCLEEELYQAGLPEWVEWVDQYIPNLDQETAARPAGKMQSTKVAILQEPEPSDLDERGYYKDPGFLERLSGYEARNGLDRSETRGFSIPQLLEAMHQQASSNIKRFLALQASIEAVSQTAGVQFTEDLEQWYEDIQLYVSMYNGLLEPRSEYASPPHYLGMPKLDQLKIGRLKATASSLRYYRERMAIALGDDWIREAFKTLDFRPTEAGSLAELMATEMKKASQELGLAEEESDGQEA